MSYSAPALLNIEIIAKQEQAQSGAIKRRFHSWRVLIENSKNKSIQVQLKRVNDFFNQFEFQSDSNYQGQEDYWKAPDEFVLDGGGDCEDFSIAKYFTLLAIGVPTKQLRITYVKSIKLNQAHMVLAYYPQPIADPLVLDNLVSDILPASKRADLVPIYSFNGEGLWLAKTAGKKDKPIGNATGLSKWRQVLEHMQKGK
ncbi:periplasmic protein [Legionella gratiana]|uniref:Periplasmic protein n=1 Tax=Legionella gratiana TaxID=45066 RepID=A0A378J3G3_9GAMM|nr:transglutaminase-like cysteine peptidase [Legionella gratiana]KTD14481.1 periplasmic protein [Legionella gratiana]STX42049.1 periplasmic protein [Legionella gratiana]